MFPLEIKSIWLTSFHKDSWRHLVQLFWKRLTICKITFSLKFNCVYWYTSISLIVCYICTCLNCLEDEFHFFTWMSVVPWIKKKTYIKPYHWKRLKMSKFIELIKKTENKIEIRILSMFIMKSFEIRKKSFILISMHFTLSFCIYT